MCGEDEDLRLTALLPHELSADQRAVYEEITTGPRAKSRGPFRLVEDDGSLTGPFDAMLRAPEVGMAAQRLGAALRYRSSLADRDREVATLTVAAIRRSGYEWYAHESAARAAGVTEDDLVRLRDGRHDELAAQRDRAVAQATAAALTECVLPPASMAELRGWLSTQQTVELLVLIGYYDLLALLMSALQVPLPHGVADPFGS